VVIVAIVDVVDVAVDYPGEVRALDGVNLHVLDGEFMAVLGPSGSGKTTLLRVVAGLERASSGIIRFDGEDVTTMAARDRNVSMVFQDGALYPHLTAERNLGFPMRIRGEDEEEIDRRVDQVAAALTLTQYLQNKPAELSSGHRHGVATGRAILGAGRLLLMDEPLANLDSRTRRRVRGELRERKAAQETTILYATNDQEEAMALADRMVVLEAGRVRQIGTPGQIYRRPADTFVASFVGSPPMNITAAKIHSDGAVVAVGSRRLALAGSVVASRPRLRSFFGKSVLIGIRPEHLHYGGADDIANEQRIGGEVVQVEFLGNERQVHFADDEGASFVARLPVDGDIRIGGHVALDVDTTEMHFFDPANGVAI